MKFLIIILSALAAVSCTGANDCDESKANKAYDDRKYSEAYEILRGCDDLSSLSGLTLYHFSTLNAAYGESEFESTSEYRKESYRILEMGALKGNFFAVNALALVYGEGDPEIDFSPNASVADCLHKESESFRRANPARIRECLSVIPESEKKF